MEIHAVNIRKLTLHFPDRLVSLEILVAKMDLKISGCHVIYGVTFPTENLTASHVVFLGLMVLVTSRRSR